ncbi:MAG: ABC transporter substrate-binding protein, partial [Dehalococcoidia bacterium]
WLSSVPAVLSRWRVDPKSADMGAAGEWFKYNPAESKKLLAAAGYPNGLPVRYIFTNNIYGDTFNQIAEAVGGMLKEGGFNTQTVTQDYQREYITPGTGTFFGSFEGVFFGLQTGYLDAHDYIFNMMHSKSTRNHAGISDPQLDAMIDKEGTTIDENERVKLYKDIERYVADKVYYAPGATGVAYQGGQEWLKNYCWNLGAYGYGTETFGKVWIDRT